MKGAPSYVSGTSDQPLLYRSIGGVLSDAAAHGEISARQIEARFL